MTLEREQQTLDIRLALWYTKWSTWRSITTGATRLTSTTTS